MGNDGIRVNHASLDAAAQQMMQTVKDIDDRLNRLEQELRPLQSDWSGEQQRSYHTSKAKWDNAINDMKTLLQQAGNSVDQSNQDYKSADQRGAAQFDGIR